MDELHDTPTEPSDYLALTAGYGALLGSLLMAIRDGGDQPVRPGEIVPLGVATFAMAKLITREKVGSSVRQPFLEETETGDRRPRGRGLRFAVGELMSCSRCVGAWASLGVVGLRVVRPREARVITAVLGASAVNDWLQAGFSLLCARTNAAEAAAGSLGQDPGS